MTELPKHIKTLFRRYDNNFTRMVESRGKCNQCGDIIQSKHTHDYVTCKCGSFSLDGGLSYVRCTFKHGPDSFTLMTKFKIKEHDAIQHMLSREERCEFGIGSMEERTELYEWIRMNNMFGQEIFL